MHENNKKDPLLNADTNNNDNKANHAQSDQEENERLLELLHSGRFSDVSLVIIQPFTGENSFHLHRAIVAVKCAFFWRAFDPTTWAPLQSHTFNVTLPPCFRFSGSSSSSTEQWTRAELNTFWEGVYRTDACLRHHIHSQPLAQDASVLGHWLQQYRLAYFFGFWTLRRLIEEELWQHVFPQWILTAMTLRSSPQDEERGNYLCERLEFLLTYFHTDEAVFQGMAHQCIQWALTLLPTFITSCAENRDALRLELAQALRNSPFLLQLKFPNHQWLRHLAHTHTRLVVVCESCFQCTHPEHDRHEQVCVNDDDDEEKVTMLRHRGQPLSALPFAVHIIQQQQSPPVPSMQLMHVQSPRQQYRDGNANKNGTELYLGTELFYDSHLSSMNAGSWYSMPSHPVLCSLSSPGGPVQYPQQGKCMHCHALSDDLHVFALVPLSDRKQGKKDEASPNVSMYSLPLLLTRAAIAAAAQQPLQSPESYDAMPL